MGVGAIVGAIVGATVTRWAVMAVSMDVWVDRMTRSGREAVGKDGEDVTNSSNHLGPASLSEFITRGMHHSITAQVPTLRRHLGLGSG